MFHPISPAACDYTISPITTPASAALFSGEVIMGPAQYYHPGLAVAFWVFTVLGSSPRLGDAACLYLDCLGDMMRLIDGGPGLLSNI